MYKDHNYISIIIIMETETEIDNLIKESNELGLDAYDVTHLWTSLNTDMYIPLKMRKYISKFLKEDDPINLWLSEINEKTAQIPKNIKKEILRKLPHLSKLSNHFYPHVTSTGNLHRNISDALTAKGYTNILTAKGYTFIMMSCDYMVHIMSLKSEEEWKTDFPDFANNPHFNFKHFDKIPLWETVDEIE